MIFFKTDAFFDIKENDGPLHDQERMLKDFSTDLSVLYRKKDIVFQDMAGPGHTEYVFPFTCFVDGKESQKSYRLSFPSDGVGNRFKKALETPAINLTLSSEKINNKFERCKVYMRNNGTKNESEIAYLPVQNKSDAQFLKLMFFIRLFSKWIESKPEHQKELGLHRGENGALLDVDEKNADEYLLGIIFYKQKIKILKERKTNADYINFIFHNKETSRERLEGFEKIPPDIAEKFNDAGFDDLIEQLKQHPLLCTYLKGENNQTKMKEKRKDLLSLLKQCVSYQEVEDTNMEVKFVIEPVIGNIIVRKKQEIMQEVSKERFSPYAYYHFFGKLAEMASCQSKRHQISFETAYSVFESETEFIENGYNQMLEQLIENKYKDKNRGKALIEFAWFEHFIEIKDDAFRFKDKLTRLFFTANYISMDYNEFSLFDRLLTCCRITDGSVENLVNVLSSFDSLILLSTMTLHFLPWHVTKRFLYYLATEQANRYDIRIRYKQIAAIAIISYSGLWECYLIDNESRELLFKAAYGNTQYDFQLNHIDRLLKQPFYEKIIENHFNKLRENPLDTQPQFFFLYHNKSILGNQKYASDKYPISNQMIHSCLLYRDRTWRNNFETLDKIKIFEKFVSNAVGESINFFKNKEIIAKDSYEFMIRIYAIQALLFAVSNYSKRYPIKFLNRDNKSRLMEIAIYCDYYTRKNNLIYQKIYSDKNSSDEELKDMVLLCGPFRVSSIRKYKIDSVFLTDEMKADYIKWLKNEKGRYKILLMRLLAYSNFYDRKNPFKGNDIPDVSNKDFLEYDNIDIDKIYLSKNQNNESIDSSQLLEWYKKP